MRNLTIKRVKYLVETESSNKYQADVSFETGLNIIYGPNSVGKSSLITGIIYCLGGEKSLGIFQNKQNPFKPEFYDKIENEKVKSSYVLLEISNGTEIFTLARSILGKTDVVGLKETTIESFNKVTEIKYLIANGEGVFSDDGLQTFLFNFLGWNAVNLPTYDGALSKLYFENLLPLFFVEQRAGWSQIQARQVMRYGIRDIKKVVFEYLLGLDRFESHVKEIERKEVQEKLLKLKRDLLEKEENILIVVNGKIEKNEILVERPDYGRAIIYDMINILEKVYEEGQLELGTLTNSTEKSGEQEGNLRNSLKTTSHQVRKSVEKINSLLQEISSYESYIDRININKQKNKQLKKIEGLAPDLNISSCPICENPLPANDEGNCKLCHQELKRKISTPDENLEFLEDEKSSFEKILESKRLELRKIRHKHEELKSKEKSITENLDHQINTYVGPQLDRIRKRISELDYIFNDINILKRQSEKWKKLELIREQILQLEELDKGLKTIINSFNQSPDDRKILSSIVTFFKENVKTLRLLKGKDNLVNQIKIDENDFYTPYLDEYDLYNISSSSDNVRVIISYYLCMLQTSIQLGEMNKIKFPNLLILDEPKQQNLDDKDLISFIEILEKLPQGSAQIILTTFSEQKRNKKVFESFIRLEMKDEFDFLLKKVN
jgi:predicted ATPase